ncbi:MAG: dihydrofolate reductase [Bauldia sp.]|nr:dihydrofolate reductase [Bauldia sp.]
MRIRGYMAASADGYIADREGGISWLDPFNDVDAGYGAFIAGIGTVVMGRRTYDQVRTFGAYPYAAQRSIIVTHRPIEAAPPGVEAWREGVTSLIAQLRQTEGERDAWIVGGAALQAEFIAAGALDSLELFVIPVLLGDGVRMFPPSPFSRPLRLDGATALGKGMVRLAYGLTP